MPIRTAGFRIAKILGIPIYLDATWLLIFGLITYTLAMDFRQMHPQWTPTEHWSLGILTSLLFFASVLFHELAHSVVALHYQIPVHSITLFLFGGIARIGREPSKPIQEFNIAVAGPLASILLAGAFGAMTLLFPSAQMVGALAKILGGSNFILAVFNLAPGFPLDGGRIFRAIEGHITLEEYGAEVLRTGRRCHLVLSGDRLVGMMNVHTLNSVPREQWANNSVQSAMIPRDKIQWTSPDEPLLKLLERLLTADINQMPVVSGAADQAPQIVGMVTRDSILRVMQTHSELASQFSGK